jgi:intein/homing endonuclease
MAVFLYAPGIKAYVSTQNNGIIDISDDLTQGTMVRRSDGVSTFSFSLQNPFRKYSGVFTPNDRIIVMMKRVSWVRTFTGYLNQVPLVTAWPSTVQITASCSLKRLQYWFWDPGLPQSQNMVAQAMSSAANPDDGGTAAAVIAVLQNVVGWPAANIHIAGMPQAWSTWAYQIAQAIQADTAAADALAQAFYASLGAGGIIGGVTGGGTTVPSGTLQAGTYAGQTLTAAQVQTATLIYNTIIQMGGSANDAAVAIMTAYQESRLGANTGSSPSAIGIFQQNPAMGWGTAAQAANPTTATQAFGKVLLSLTNRSSMTDAQQAQAVQRSAFADGSPYAQWQSLATTIVGQLTASGSSSLANVPSTAANAATKTGKAAGTQVLGVALNLVATHSIPYQEGGDSGYTSADPTVLDCCITEGVFVYTVDGPKPVVEIKPGDQVYTWEDGSIGTRPVHAMMPQKVQPVFKVRTRNRTVRASANHPFLRLTRTERRLNSGKGFLPVDWRTEWCRADELRRDDLLIVLDNLPGNDSGHVMSDGTPIDEKTAWLLGLILADGHVLKGDRGFEVCVYGELRERVRTLVKELWGLRGGDHPAHGISFGSKKIAQALTALGMKVPGPEKRVPPIIFRMPPEIQRAFLDGFWEGDGSGGPVMTNGKRGRAYHSASEKLIGELRAMHIALGDSVTNISTNKRAKPIVIKGKLVKNPRPLHTFLWYADSRKQGQRLRDLGAYSVIKDGRFRIERLLGVDPDGEEMTYDIEVDGAHNFIADGMVVHNSSFVQWVYYHATGSAAVPRTSQEQSAWATPIPLQQALNTPGALLFVGPPGAATHVEISAGTGADQVGAMTTGTVAGVTNVTGFGYTNGGLMPGVDYSGTPGTAAAYSSVPGNGAAMAAGSPAAASAGTSALPQSQLADGALQVTPSSTQPWYNPADPFDALFGSSPWLPTFDADAANIAEILTGPRALMADSPLLPYIKNLFGSCMRSYCSAPNGDLIAWFPDYYGIWGTAAVMQIESIELQDFTVYWSDENLVTHQFVVAAPAQQINLGSGVASGITITAPAGTQSIPEDLLFALTTMGIASIDVPAIMSALFGLDANSATAKTFTQYVYKRFGARPDLEQLPGLVGPQGEFFAALFLFMRSWAYQYDADVPMTFMPELWPGMLIQVPDFSFQAYVTTVTHTFQMGQGGFFNTTVNIAAPSRIPGSGNNSGGQLIGLPIAGGLVAGTNLPNPVTNLSNPNPNTATAGTA